MDEKQNLIEVYYNVYKDMYGHKPRYIDCGAMSIAELQQEIKEVAAAKRQDEAYWKEQNEENILSMMKNGAPDRKTAERWARQT